MSEQLAQWQGQFGIDYLARNQVDWKTRVHTLRRILRDQTGIRDALEVGCNRGHNLRALETALDNVNVRGVEPAAAPRREAWERGFRVKAGTIYDLPFANGRFDLAFTSGVLIHVPPAELDQALAEMHRVTSRFLLAIEYHDDVDTEVTYRGLGDMLWRRDYGAHYTRLFPELSLVGSGDLVELDGFGGARYWLLEKP